MKPWIIRSLSNFIVFGAVFFGVGGSLLLCAALPTHPISPRLVIGGAVLGAISGVLWSLVMWKLFLEKRSSG